MTTQPRTAGWVAGIALAVATMASFSGVLQAGFVFDDSAYIINNPLVQLGLTPEGLRWSFTTFYAANWHPLTWLSHLFDLRFFGLAPTGHHATSLVLHAVNSLVLLVVLQRLTGLLWRSAWTAAIFALHPLRVESVAWVAERKDVLSLLLALLMIAAYLGSVRRTGRGSSRVVVLAFAAGLLAKPMLVTLPLVLLLLDYWPLGRFESPGGSPRCVIFGRLALEKLPLLALSLASAVVTVLAQWRGEAMIAGDSAFTTRVANACVAIARYLGKTFWPEGLAVYYPLPLAGHPAWKICGSAVLVALLCTAALLARRRYPFVLVGILWFLVTLSPVLGLIQVGNQALADRYTYLPHIGLFLGLAWLAAALARRRPAWKPIAIAAALAILVPLSLATAAQVRFWRDEITLYSRAVTAVPDNWFMHYNLANAFEEKSRFAEAIKEYENTVRIRPDHPDAHFNLGRLLQQSGRNVEAARHYIVTLRLRPGDADAHNNLALVLAAQNRTEEAISHLREALRLKPDHREARQNLTLLLARRRGG